MVAPAVPSQAAPIGAGPPVPPPAVLHDRARFGMLVYLTSKTMIFVALVGAYIVLAMAQSWPPKTGPQLTIASAMPATGLLALSAMTILSATRGIRRNDKRAAVRGLMLTGAIGLAFVGIQVLEWHQLHRDGFAESTYGQYYFVMTIFHMIYVVSGLAIIAFVLRRALQGRYDAVHFIGIDLATIWWHFCGGVWVLLFSSIHLLPRFLAQ